MLSNAEKERYARQIMLPKIGIQGQERLKKARVLVAGAGGLGSVSLLYLAAAGVGHLSLVDHDVVGLSNLNRQILYSIRDLDRPKSESARDRILDLNPHVIVSQVNGRINETNVEDLVRNADIVVDALDNLAARKVLNRLSVKHGKPFIFGGVSGFDGMVSTFIPGKTPCLECLFPKHRPQTETGVVGPAPGIIASMQSLEVIKLIVDKKPALAGTLARFRGMDMTLKKVHILKDPECPVCGKTGD